MVVDHDGRARHVVMSLRWGDGRQDDSLDTSRHRGGIEHDAVFLVDNLHTHARRDVDGVFRRLEGMLIERVRLLIAHGDLLGCRLGDRMHVLLRVRLEVVLPHHGDHADGDKRRHGRDEGERNRYARGV